MSGEEFVLSIMAMVLGASVLITAIVKGTDLIKSWMNRGSGYNDESFERLARAFVQHKKEMTERIQNIEAIVADTEDSGSISQIEAPTEDPQKSVLNNDLDHKKRLRQ
jgi:hypothetical protein